MSAAPSGRLVLRALDVEDLAVVSAAMQDALVAVKDIGWFAAERRFALVANRFRWEIPADTDGAWSRTHAALSFEDVEAVRHAEMPLGEPDRVLDLLSVSVDVRAGGGVAVVLRFAAGRAIRIEAARLLCHMADLGDPWPTPWRPAHEAADGRDGG